MLGHIKLYSDLSSVNRIFF